MQIDEQGIIEISSGPAEWSLLEAGDLCPIGRVESGLIEEGPEAVIGGSLLAKMREADLTIVNLEAPLSEREKPIPKIGPNFIASPKIADTLRPAGIDVVAMANNHILDQDVEGLAATISALDAAGVGHHGAALAHEEAARPLRYQTPGCGVSLINLAEGEFGRAYGEGPGAASFDVYRTSRLIERERRESRAVIVTVHAGNEHQPFPSPLIQQAYRRFIDAGAALVIGHHPHIPQGVERWGNGFIAYSLGNFLFDYPGHTGRPGTRIGYLVSAEFSGTDVRRVKLIPYRDAGEARVAGCDDADTTRVSKLLSYLSAPLTDAVLLKRLWEEETRELYATGYAQHFERISRLPEVADRSPIPAGEARILFNIVRCEAHHHAIQTALGLMHEGRFASDSQARDQIDRAHAQIDAIVGDSR